MEIETFDRCWIWAAAVGLVAGFALSLRFVPADWQPMGLLVGGFLGAASGGLGMMALLFFAVSKRRR